MASAPDQHSSPASFYASPQEARHARPEGFLYLACLHEGTGVDADAEHRGRAPPLRLEPL